MADRDGKDVKSAPVAAAFLAAQPSNGSVPVEYTRGQSVDPALIEEIKRQDNGQKPQP